MIEHLRAEELHGGYEAEAAALDRVERTYDAIAELIGAGRDEIALVENATRAWDMAFYGFRFSPGDVVLVASSEYSSSSL
ncbi:MAG TPA: aminotransferase class V-fold PLP-dependent enzyme, partial [Solirubrobacteraceae bacterium]|nr:aminotransferase class V-fold PLP-dependent enzyme [Solirubrobacteraceae bacterium]